MAYFDPEQLFETMLDAAPGVSDLNLSVGASPQIEVDRALSSVSFEGLDRLLPYHTELIAMRSLNDKVELAERLIETGSGDLSYSLRQRARFRVNVFSQRGTYSIVLRVIANEIPSFDDLGLPSQLKGIANERNGIVLVTGPTGSGKSTTLAAIIDKMNRERAIHIITSGPVLEDGKTLYKRLDYLAPEARRHTFLILIGEEFQTGDGNQAFAAAADLVAHPSELGEVGALLTRRVEEKTRIYRAFTDAQARRDRHR